MNKHNEFLDSISIDPVLHDKIMKKVRQSNAHNKNKVVFRYVRIAACVAVVLLGIWIIPGLFTNNRSELNILIFNATPSYSVFGLDRAVGFTAELTNEQINAVFPSVNLPLVSHPANIQSKTG